jgi:hypothetical protein
LPKGHKVGSLGYHSIRTESLMILRRSENVDRTTETIKASRILVERKKKRKMLNHLKKKEMEVRVYICIAQKYIDFNFQNAILI